MCIVEQQRSTSYGSEVGFKVLLKISEDHFMVTFSLKGYKTKGPE